MHDGLNDQTNDGSEPSYRYKAFISYSHQDESWGTWLHKSLESYRTPAYLKAEGKPAGLSPIFRDREELPTASDLGEMINAALESSEFLIVICSPQSAASRWVNEEVMSFKRMGGAGRILCLIVEGEPNGLDKGQPELECFCPALRYALNDAGELSEDRREALAADVREHADGKSDARLKLIAGLLGVGFDQLKRREELRKRKRLAALGSILLAMVLILSVLTGWAIMNQFEAEKQRGLAEERANEAQQQRDEAARQRDEAQKQKKIAEDQLVTANHRFGIALIERANRYRESGDLIWADLSLARAIGFQGYGASKTQGPQVYLKPDSDEWAIVEEELSRSEERLEPIWVRPLHDSGSKVTVTRFSPDGQFLAVGTASGVLLLMELGNGHVIWSKNPKKTAVRNLSFDASGESLIYVDELGHVLNFSSRDGVIQKEYEGHRRKHGDAPFNKQYQKEGYWHFPLYHVAVSPDGKMIAAGGFDWLVHVWDMETGKLIHQYKGHKTSVDALLFSEDGRMIISAASEELRVQNLYDPDHVYTVKDLGSRVKDVVLSSPDGLYLTVLTEDQILELNVDQMKVTHRRDHQDSGFIDMGRLDRLGARVVSDHIRGVNYDGYMARGAGGNVTALDLSPDDLLLAYGDDKGRVSLWLAGHLMNEKQLQRHDQTWTEHSVFSQNGKWYLHRGEKALKLWHTDYRALFMSVPHDKPIQEMRVANDGQHVVLLEKSGKVVVLNQQGKRINEENSGQIRGMMTSVDLKKIYLINQKGRVESWHALAGASSRSTVIAETAGTYHRAAISASGQWMVRVSIDQDAKGIEKLLFQVWDLNSKQLSKSWDLQPSDHNRDLIALTGLVINNAGDQVWALSDDTIWRWVLDVKTGGTLKKIDLPHRARLDQQTIQLHEATGRVMVHHQDVVNLYDLKDGRKLPSLENPYSAEEKLYYFGDRMLAVSANFLLWETLQEYRYKIDLYGLVGKLYGYEELELFALSEEELQTVIPLNQSWQFKRVGATVDPQFQREGAVLTEGKGSVVEYLNEEGDTPSRLLELSKHFLAYDQPVIAARLLLKVPKDKRDSDLVEALIRWLYADVQWGQRTEHWIDGTGPADFKAKLDLCRALSPNHAYTQAMIFNANFHLLNTAQAKLQRKEKLAVDKPIMIAWADEALEAMAALKELGQVSLINPKQFGFLMMYRASEHMLVGENQPAYELLSEVITLMNKLDQQGELDGMSKSMLPGLIQMRDKLKPVKNPMAPGE